MRVRISSFPLVECFGAFLVICLCFLLWVVRCSYSGALAAVSSGLMQKQSFLRNKGPKAPLFGSANLLANALGISVVLTLFAVR